MMPAAKMMDPVMGVDIHIIQPPGPVPPIPVPHPFIGMLMDPMDFVPIVGATIMVNGMPRAIAGTAGKALPPHIPIGGMFVKPPANECEMFMGSATVVLDGDPASYMALPALSCQDIGMPAPPRPNPKKKTKMKSLVLPTSVVLPIPAGLPVLIGGPPTISMMAMGMKAGMAGLGKLLKKPAKLLKRKLKKLKKAAARKMKPGFIKCKVLRAEPVHIITGEVMVEQRDFALGWRVPLDWTRHYGSQRQRVGLLGRGWETPADARLELDADGSVTFHDGTPGAAVFPSWPVNGPVTELVAGAVLDRSDDGAGVVVRVKGGLRWYFRAPVAGEREVPVAHVADGCDNWLQYVRDEHGTLTEIRDSSGRSVAVRLQGGLLAGLALADPDTGRLLPLVRYEYDNRGDLSAVYDALNVPYRFGYDWQRRLERHTDRVGLSFYYEYDAPTRDARCVHAWGDGGLYDYRFEYLPAVGQVRVTDSLGHTSVVEYDENELPVREVDPLGGVTTWEYDDAGRCAAEVDAAGRRTGWEYDDRGNLVKETGPDGAARSHEYDADGRLTLTIDANGGRWVQEWDERGRLVRRARPRGGDLRYAYDAQGDLVETTDALGHTSRFERDRLGRVSRFVDPSGQAIQFTLDAAGNTIARSDDAGRRMEYQYDRKGRLVAAVDPTGETSQCRYDAEDRPQWVQERGGSVTELRYVGLGGIARRVNADGTSVQYLYDTEERLVGVVNEREQRFVLERDALGRVIRSIDYWGGVTTYVHDAIGLVRSRTDALGRTTSYSYDAADRLVSATYADGSADRYEYDLAGNLVRASNATVDVTRRYDEDGNLVEERQGDFTVTSEYDAYGRRTRRRSSFDHEVCFAYDERGLAIEIDLDGQPLVQTRRDSLGQPVAERLAGGMERTIARDVLGRLVGQQLTVPGKRAVSARAYRYGRTGELIERVDGDQAVRYAYDPVGRLIEEIDAAGAVTRFQYDPSGDLLEEEAPGLAGERARGTAGRRVARSESTRYEFDAAGRLAYRAGPAGTARFEWDGANRLAGVVTEDGTTVTFAYDALGRRVAKRTPDGVTSFHWDGDQLLADEVQPGHPREFVHRPGTFEVLASTNGQVAHFENDPTGLPRQVVDATGRELWSADYDGIGQQTRVDSAGFDNPIRFQGQYHDAETGLSYNRFRYFDQESAAFISQDPLGLAPGPNVYSYAPNVWMWADPYGLACDTVFHSTTNSRAAQGVAGGIDPKFLNPNSRFGAAFYVAEVPETALAELAHHGAQGTHMVRMSVDKTKLRVLDLTDPSVAASVGYHGGPISSATQQVGADALSNGYNAIKFKSLRGAGDNYAVLDDFNDILTPEMISPV